MHPGSSSPMDELLVGVRLDGLVTARKEDLDKEEDIACLALYNSSHGMVSIPLRCIVGAWIT